jgi:hypothetical protein
MTREVSKSRILKGKLEIFFEQGMEHNAWTFYEDGQQGYDGLHVIEKGDVLRVFNDAARKELLWQGTIDFEYDSHKQKRAMIGEVQWLDNVGTVHGIQKGVDANEWGEMFRQEKPAVLIPKRPDKHVP